MPAPPRLERRGESKAAGIRNKGAEATQRRAGHPLPFLTVGLAVLAAFVTFGISAFVFGLMTCCLGFLLLVVPYLSNVLLLPLTVLYRSFTLEFLAQFDDDLLPRPEIATPLPDSA